MNKKSMFFYVCIGLYIFHNDCREQTVPASVMPPLEEPAIIEESVFPETSAQMPSVETPSTVEMSTMQSPVTDAVQEETMVEPEKVLARHKLLADALIEYANQASKTLENIPSLIKKTKKFVDESLLLVARIKNDLEMAHESIRKTKSKTDAAERLMAVNNLIDQQIVPLISHLAQLSLKSAELMYATNDEILESFSNKVASDGMSTAIKIRDMARVTKNLTDALHDMAKQSR